MNMYQFHAAFNKHGDCEWKRGHCITICQEFVWLSRDDTELFSCAIVFQAVDMVRW
jgi:hypothetical protein